MIFYFGKSDVKFVRHYFLTYACLDVLFLKDIYILTLTCAGNAVNARSEVLDDRHGASLDAQDAGQLDA